MTHFENVIEALRGIKSSEIDMLEAAIRAVRARRGRVLTCGNGGSAATAIHFAADLRSIGIDASDLLSPAKLTQLGNDAGFNEVFRQQRHGGLLVAFSCSGTSKNILAALREGDILITSRLCPADTPHHLIVVPSVDYEVIEDCHLAICHAVKKALM